MSTVEPEQQPQILHRQEMSHLLLGDRKNVGAPTFDQLPALACPLVGSQRICGVEILHHQAVLDGGAE